MSYLSEKDIIEIQDNVSLLSIKDVDNVSHYLFDSHIDDAKHTISMRKDIFVDE